MRRTLSAILALMLSTPAAAAPLTALVIGNESYTRHETLRNPDNDADEIQEVLQSLGYAVIRRDNLTLTGFSRALDDLEREARGADTIVIFYSGHGVEYQNRNYLVPVDASLRHPRHLLTGALNLEAIKEVAATATRLGVVILDACRDNNFFGLKGGSAKGMQAVASGVKLPGLAIGFATSGGRTAQDGIGTLSPYTRALTEALRANPDQDVRLLLTSLADATTRYASEDQNPDAWFGRLPSGVQLPIIPASAVKPPENEKCFYFDGTETCFLID